MFRSCLILTLFALMAASCQNKTPGTDYAKEGYAKAVVIKYEVESCGYLLQLADEKKSLLAPDKLPDELKKDKQKVWVKYAPLKKQMMGTCMAGTQVAVADIRIRK
jgi:hypothetical protein